MEGPYVADGTTLPRAFLWGEPFVDGTAEGFPRFDKGSGELRPEGEPVGMFKVS